MHHPTLALNHAYSMPSYEGCMLVIYGSHQQQCECNRYTNLIVSLWYDHGQMYDLVWVGKTILRNIGLYRMTSQMLCSGVPYNIINGLYTCRWPRLYF